MILTGLLKTLAMLYSFKLKEWQIKIQGWADKLKRKKEKPMVDSYEKEDGQGVK